MSTGTIPACGLGLTAATLSAWRDQTLSTAEAERVRTHAARCVACQERLAEYDAIAQALQAQRVPEPDKRLWLAVRAGMAERRTRGRGMGLVAHAQGAWKGLAAAAAVLLVVAGFAQALRSLSLGRTVGVPRPTATTAGTAALAWQRAPFHTVLQHATDRLSLAPSDGNTMYVCDVSASAQGAQLSVWATHDRAAHWIRTASIPLVRSADTYDSNSSCTITVDQVDPRTVVAVLLPTGLLSPLKGSANFVTTDGGMSWRKLPDAQPFAIEQLATWGGVAYAVRFLPLPSTPPNLTLSLSVSHDGMRTWQPIDQAITAAGQQAETLWIAPSSGEVLVETIDATGAPVVGPLWDTRDGGRTWSHLPPPSLVAWGSYAVQASSAGQPWHICKLSGASPDQANELLCSVNSGQDWLERPTLNFTYTCLKCSGGPGTPTTEVFDMKLVAIASDGAVLATVEVPQGPVTVPATGNSKPPILTLYRLPAGGTAWQSLGPVPQGPILAYIAIPGAGVLWSVADDGTVMTAAYP